MHTKSWSQLFSVILFNSLGTALPQMYTWTRVLTIYMNHPGENLLHKNKSIKFDVVGERPTPKHIQIMLTGSNE